MGQHRSLTSFQPGADLLGHGWKGMGVLMVPDPRGYPPRANNSSLSTESSGGSAEGSSAEGSAPDASTLRCSPLQTDRSGSPSLSLAEEASLAVDMCWTLHRTLGAHAYRACSSPLVAGIGRMGGRVLVKYRRIGFERSPAARGRSRAQVLYEHTLNFTAAEARDIFRAASRAEGRAARHQARRTTSYADVQH